MEEKKVYRLLKDLPSINTGALAYWDEKANCYKIEKSVWVSPHRYDYLSKGTVTQSPEWFELVTPERIEVTIMANALGEHNYLLKSSHQWPKDKFPLIKQTIEQVLNNDNNSIEKEVIKQQQLIIDQLKIEIQYSEQKTLEAEEKAFDAGKAKNTSIPCMRGDVYYDRYVTFSDYKNKTNAQ